MGTRLYPMTENTEILERLAGVPVGTYELYKAIKDEHAERKAELERKWYAATTEDEKLELHFQYEDVAAEFYDRMQENPDVSALDQFIGSGWGKIQFPADCYGEVTDPITVRQLLCIQGADLNGVTIEELEGIYWC